MGKVVYKYTHEHGGGVRYFDTLEEAEQAAVDWLQANPGGFRSIKIFGETLVSTVSIPEIKTLTRREAGVLGGAGHGTA